MKELERYTPEDLKEITKGSRELNFTMLGYLLTELTNPADLAKTLNTLYYDYSQILLETAKKTDTAYIIPDNIADQLYYLRSIITALQGMNEPANKMSLTLSDKGI